MTKKNCSLTLNLQKRGTKSEVRGKTKKRNEEWQTGRKREWEKGWERMMTPLSTSSVVRGRDSAPTSHMEDHPQATHTHTQWQKIPVPVLARLCLFVSTPINSALEAPHHMLPVLNSWAAGLLAAVVWSNFQSVPPQRKRSLTPATRHQQPSPRRRSFTGNPIWGQLVLPTPRRSWSVGLRWDVSVCGCWFPL